MRAAAMASPRISPHVEAAVGGDDDRAAVVAAGDQCEEQVGSLALEWEVADLVDDEQVVALQAPELLLELVAVLRRFQRETHSWAAAKATGGRARRL
jgi:hypothetical protein